jgi:hypothetical protein
MLKSLIRSAVLGGPCYLSREDHQNIAPAAAKIKQAKAPITFFIGSLAKETVYSSNVHPSFAGFGVTRSILPLYLHYPRSRPVERNFPFLRLSGNKLNAQPIR